MSKNRQSSVDSLEFKVPAKDKKGEKKLTKQELDKLWN